MSEYIVELIEARMSGKPLLHNLSCLGMEPIVRCRDCKRFQKVTPHRCRPETIRLREFVEANKPHMTWDELHRLAVTKGFRYRSADTMRITYQQAKTRATVTRCLKFGTNDPDGFCSWGERRDA